ncbi:MAG: potassium channel family protein [Cyclobacteriaceae bacterium]|nr:potassium channel family protein [Cyclobacteriaceae bacterium]
MAINKKYTLYISIFGLLCLVFALNNLLVYVERSSPNSSIKSLPDAMWYMIITLTTVGYGDLYPTTASGKMIGYIFVFGSLGVLGYLFSSLSSKYRTMIEEKKLGFRGTNFENHIIFIGWNDFSRMVAEEIYHTGKKIAIVTNSKDEIDLIYAQFGKENTFALFADIHHLDSLDNANVSRASAVFISIPDDAQVLLYVLDFKKRFPNHQVVVSIENPKLKDTFKSAGVTYAIARNEIASKMVASYIFEPDVATLNSDLISSARAQHDNDMQEYLIDEQNKYVGRDYLEVFIDMKKVYNAVLVGISRKTATGWTLIANPEQGESIQTNDYLLLMCNGVAKKRIRAAFGVEEGRISVN